MREPSLQELKDGLEHAATLERQMHELEASSGASQVQAAELAGLRDRVTTQLKVGPAPPCAVSLGFCKAGVWHI